MVTFDAVFCLQIDSLNPLCRYGLVGLNGSGKSTLLMAISERELPIPNHIDIFHLAEEMAPSDKTPLQCVMEVDQERLVVGDVDGWEGERKGGRGSGKKGRGGEKGRTIVSY